MVKKARTDDPVALEMAGWTGAFLGFIVGALFTLMLVVLQESPPDLQGKDIVCVPVESLYIEKP